MATPAPATAVADTSAFGGPNATQAAAANAQLATSNNSVPTTAPSGQTSTSAPAASPTTVVSSQPAIDQVGKMQNTLTQAQIDLQNQQSIKASEAYNAAHPQTPATPGGAQPGADQSKAGTSGYDVFGNPVKPALDPNFDAAHNTPEPGNKFVYDAKGNRSEVAIDSNPPGYTTNDPTSTANKGIIGTVTTGAGTTIQQYSDGTYGTLDINGKYISPANADDYNNAKNASDTAAKIQQLNDFSTYPLDANQKAQLDSLKADFASLVTAQQTANANLTGGTRIAENLYGMGTSLTGIGEITGTINAGLQKIADLNSKLASATAAMMSGFQSDDLKMLTASYNIYNDTVKERQTQLDNTVAAAAKAKQDAAAAVQHATDQLQVKNDAIDARIQSMTDAAEKGGGLSAAQVASLQTALKNHDEATAMQITAGSIQDPTSPAGQYSAYVKTQTAAGKAPMTAGDFLSAQKVKEAYATASASAAAQSAFTSSDKNQSKLENTYIAGINKIISSRSGELGVTAAKVDSAQRAQTLLDGLKNAKGNIDISSPQYRELAMNVANLVSGSNALSEASQSGLIQATAAGDVGKMITYVTGLPQNATSQAVIENLQNTITREGTLAETQRNQYLKAVPANSDLDPTRSQAALDHMQSNLPSYINDPDGTKTSLAYQTPEQINTTAVSKVADFVSADPKNQALYQSTKAKYPNASPTDLAQIFGLIPAAK